MDMEERENNTISVVKEEVEQSVPDRFEEHVRKYPDRIAFKTKKDALTWDALNRDANRVARAILEMCESRDRPDRKSTRLNSSHIQKSRMPSSA